MVKEPNFDKQIHTCKIKSLTREDREKCLDKVDTKIRAYLKKKHGENTDGCGKLEGKQFGVFLLDTLHRTGQGLNDIKSFKSPICRRGAEVLPVETDNNKKIFFKTAGTTTSGYLGGAGGGVGAEQIRNHNQVFNMASAVREDVPLLLNSDPIKGIVAVEGIEGEQAESGEFDDAPIMEKADALLFELLLGSFDRWNNVFREGQIIKEIDFDDVKYGKFKDIENNLSGTPRKIFSKIVYGGTIDPKIKKAVKSNIEWYREHKDLLLKLAPDIINEEKVDKAMSLLSEGLKND